MTTPKHGCPQRRRLRVLVADDSPISRRLLIRGLEQYEEIDIVGMADNGLEAIEMARRLQPDVVLMDVAMPVMDGETATRHLVQDLGVPVVALTSLDMEEATARMRMAGASAVLSKSALLGREMEAVVQTICEAARRGRPGPAARPEPHRPRVPFPVVGVAASTSGPPALRALLSTLPPTFPAAVLVAQHLSDGFAESLAEWLGAYVSLPVRTARDGLRLAPSTIYLAPDGCHITLRGDTLRTPQATAQDIWRPSADRLFVSLAESCGPMAVAVILTGMGRDGTEGAVAVRKAGGKVIVQDPQDAAVTGMPRSATERGAFDIVLPLHAIGPYLVTLVRRLHPNVGPAMTAKTHG